MLEKWDLVDWLPSCKIEGGRGEWKITMEKKKEKKHKDW